jgi:hypothetical protein
VQDAGVELVAVRAKEISPMYFTPASTFPFFSGLRTGVGSIGSPSRLLKNSLLGDG